MLDTLTVLSLRGTFGESKIKDFCPAFLLNEWNLWPIGSPLIINTRRVQDQRFAVMAQALMTINQSVAGAGLQLTPPGQTLMPFGNEHLISDHRVLEIDFFDPGKIRRLIEYIHDVGSISFVVVGMTGQVSLAADLAKYVVSAFKYHSISHFNGWKMDNKYLSGADDMKLGLLSMFDLPYCLPIFNKRKADGIGISFGTITKNATIKYGQPHRIAQADMILNNYQDNLFLVDGSYLCAPWHFGDDMIREMTDYARMELAILKDKAIRESKANSKKQFEYEKWETCTITEVKQIDMPTPEEQLVEAGAWGKLKIKDLFYNSGSSNNTSS